MCFAVFSWKRIYIFPPCFHMFPHVSTFHGAKVAVEMGQQDAVKALVDANVEPWYIFGTLDTWRMETFLQSVSTSLQVLNRLEACAWKCFLQGFRQIRKARNHTFATYLILFARAEKESHINFQCKGWGETNYVFSVAIRCNQLFT